MHVHNSVLNAMLQNVADPKLRETYGAIIAGKFPYEVYCMDPQNKAHKPGVLIGHIDGKGRCIDEPTTNSKGVPVAGIETSRDRFDGRKGFRCYCGNWSIQAAEEKPTFQKYKYPVPPTQADMNEIFGAIQASGKVQGPEFIDGRMEYDGFAIVENAV